MDLSKLTCPKLFRLFQHALPDIWQRTRGTLRPAQVLYTIMTMTVSGTHGYRAVIDHLKRSVGGMLGWDDDTPAPFPSSSSDARRKLSPEKCYEAFQLIRKSCITKTLFPKVRYRDFRLVACDSTTLALPAYENIREAFGAPKNRIGGDGAGPKANLTVLWDVTANAPLDWRLERCYASERYAVHSMLDALESTDLLIGDRGFPSYRMLTDLTHRGIAYLIRLPTGTRGAFSAAHDFAEDDAAWDTEVLIHESHPARGEPTLPVRLIKRRLENGSIAVFATNLLSVTDHPAEGLADLYCYRWDIETAFREMKIWHGLENFRARYANGIHQEVAALMIFMLLTAELEAKAKEHHHVLMTQRRENGPEEPEILFNRRQIGECVGYLLIAASKGPATVAKEFIVCMESLWRFRQKRKPGRTFPRQAKSANSKWKRTTYNTNKHGTR